MRGLNNLQYMCALGLGQVLYKIGIIRESELYDFSAVVFERYSLWTVELHLKVSEAVYGKT